jgi:putative oxidoreductase
MANDQRLIVPGVGGIYRSFDGLAEPLIRIALGALLLPHGLQKLLGWFGGRGLQANTELFNKLGYSPGWLWGNLVVATEVVGAILLIIGLWTRPAALAVAIFAINAAIFTQGRGGFFWSNGGSEYSILLFVCALFVLIRGAGGLSVDRAIGREF